MSATAASEYVVPCAEAGPRGGIWRFLRKRAVDKREFQLRKGSHRLGPFVVTCLGSAIHHAAAEFDVSQSGKIHSTRPAH